VIICAAITEVSITEMRSTEWWLQLLMTVYVDICVTSGYVLHLSEFGDGRDFISVINRSHSVSGSGHSVVKRATLDARNRPSVVVDTLNSMRRQQHAANMYYVVRSKPKSLNITFIIYF